MSAARLVWVCITGDAQKTQLPSGSNETMEALVYARYLALTGDVPTAIYSGWVPAGDDKVAWAVMVGAAQPDKVPSGGDLPMRDAVRLVWRAMDLPGAYDYIRSGWQPGDSSRVADRAKEWFGASCVFA